MGLLTTDGGSARDDDAANRAGGGGAGVGAHVGSGIDHLSRSDRDKLHELARAGENKECLVEVEKLLLSREGMTFEAALSSARAKFP